MSQVKVGGVGRRSTRVFNAYMVGWIVLLIQKSRQPEYAVAVSASGISTELDSEQLERAFLQFEGESFHLPEHLVFARGSRYDRVRNRNRIRASESGELRLSILV